MYDTRTFDRQSRTLSLRNAAPVVLPLVIVLAAMLFIMMTNPGKNAVGGRGISSYGFDLSRLLVARDRLSGTDAGRGGTPSLDNPKTLPGSQVTVGLKLADVYKLVSSDRVIGVAIDGEARAYPLWVLEAHEVCNDVVGGRAIAVTYNPLCDSAAVFDREVAGESLQFGASGLLLNSNLLMFDRRGDPSRESLWSQLQFRAISGPAAERGQTLTVRPCALVTWETWKKRHPETTVALPDPARRKAYRPNAFSRYFEDDSLRYDVRPLAPIGEHRLKTPMVATRPPGQAAWTLIPAAEFGSGFAAENQPTVYAFWFAWYALQSDLNNPDKP